MVNSYLTVLENSIFHSAKDSKGSLSRWSFTGDLASCAESSSYCTGYSTVNQHHILKYLSLVMYTCYLFAHRYAAHQ